MYKYLLVLLLSINVAFASGGKLIDYIVSNSGISDLLTKQVLVYGDDAKQVKSYVGSSLKALGIPEGAGAQGALMRRLGEIPPGTMQEINMNRGLQGLLESDVKSLKKDQIVSAINSLIYIANKHGKSSYVIACADCVNANLGKAGFKFTLEAISDSKTAALLVKELPSDPKQLQTFIRNGGMKLKMGDFARSGSMVLPEEEKALGAFVALGTKGSKEQQELVKSIIAASNGNIFDAKNPHKFWKVLSDDMTADEMAGWTNTMKEVAARMKADSKLTTEDAFYAVLKSKAGDDPGLNAQLNTLKSKRCFVK
jgi:hypothetical protein